MSVNIMLSFLSNYHLLNGRPTATKYYGDAGYVVEGEHTNEAALRYVYDKFGLDRYFCFCSKMIQKEIDYVDENSTTKSITHNNLFLERIAQHIPNIADITEFIDYTEAELSSASVLKKDNGYKDTAADLTSVKDMAGAITSFANPYLQQGTEVVLYLDTTGGFRHANTLMLAVVELLKYSGITIGNILYSNYNRDNFDENGNRVPLGKIEDITDIHGVMQLVAGAEAFISYGRTDMLNKYFKKYPPSKALNKLLKAMESFADALSLCRSGMLSSAVEGLRSAMKNFSRSNTINMHDVLFHELLLQRIEDEYEMIGDGSDKLAIIKWCLEKGFLQQAMTLYTEWVPDIIVEKRIFYTENQEIIKECSKVEYTPWAKSLLSYYVHSGNKTGASSQGPTGTFVGMLKQYVVNRNITNKQLMCSVLPDGGSQVNKVLDEIDSSDMVIALLRSNAVGINNIKEKYPRLYLLAHRLYNINPNCMPKLKFKEYWIKKFDTEYLYKALYTASNSLILEVFDMQNDIDKEEVPSKVSVAVSQGSHHKRWNVLKNMLESGAVKTDIDADTALQICEEYNMIRDLRNHINHANKDIIDAREVKERIEIYLYNLEAVVTKNSK